MRFEDIKYDFPKMPEEMRTMIEMEVNKQLKAKDLHQPKSKCVLGKTLAASIAAVMLIGTTAFAGVSIYRMQRERVGDHGINVKISETKNNPADTAGTQAAQEPFVIPDVKMEIGYLPDGMVQTEPGKYSYTNNRYQGGISVAFYRMDTGDSQFEMLHEDVLESEDISVNGHKGVYLKYPHLYEAETTFDQRVYVAFTDVHYVMEMYAASDVTKQEALKIAESIRLIPTEDQEDENIVNAWDWSAYLQSKEEKDRQAEQTDFAARVTATKEEMSHTHAIGESFSAEKTGIDDCKGLMAKVTDVQVTDDISILNPAFTDQELKDETDAGGNLLPATIQYIKAGDTQTLSEVVKSRQVPQKLVYAVVEYTNTGEQELTDVLFTGDLARIREEQGQMRMLTGESYEEPSAKDAWTNAVNRGLSAFHELLYYDVHGGERNNNYISVIQPGETVTVHMGWIVTEEELGTLYLSLDTFGGAAEFSDSSLAMGYVDIRQQP